VPGTQRLIGTTTLTRRHAPSTNNSQIQRIRSHLTLVYSRVLCAPLNAAAHIVDKTV
jgi:hypothetical protein